MTPPARPATLNEFDAWWDPIDENGLPINPEWGSQKNASELPMRDPNDPCAKAPQHCTTQLRTDAIDPAPTPSVCRFGVETDLEHAGPFAAHVNWMVASYTGTVRPTMPPISD
ncbi:MAG TPA: hypothetical protein VFA59_04785, partial [Vicinamibacterales bacterium]|nr:hypothetical protein [Vicinamibacterales bacterium]